MQVFRTALIYCYVLFILILFAIISKFNHVAHILKKIYGTLKGENWFIYYFSFVNIFYDQIMLSVNVVYSFIHSFIPYSYSS